MLPATDAPAPPNSTPRTPVLSIWIGRALLLAAFVGLLVACANPARLWWEHARAALAFPYPLNYGEGPLLMQAVRAGQSGVFSLYSPLADLPPYTITNYPPLYVLAQAPFVAANGASFAYGRAISLACALIAAVAAIFTVRGLTRHWLAGIVAGLLLFCTPYVFFWSAFARIDLMALALSLCGLAVVANLPHRAWAIVLAAALCAAAGYTRQTYFLAAPMGAFAYLFTRRTSANGLPRYNALLFAVASGVFALLPLPALIAGTRGGFVFHIVTANVNLLDQRLIYTYVAELSAFLPALLLRAFVFLFLGWLFRTPSAQHHAFTHHPPPTTYHLVPGWWMLTPYLLGSVATALTIAKVGSDVNYLLEFCAGLCLIAGAWVAHLWHVGRRFHLIGAILAAAWVGVLAWQVGQMGELSAGKYAPLVNERLAQRPQLDELFALVQAQPPDTPILADEYLGLLPLAGRRIVFQPFEMSQLAQVGVWDEIGFVAQIERGDYPLLLLYQPYRNPGLRFERWTRAMLRAINNVYRPDRTLAETSIYRVITSE